MEITKDKLLELAKWHSDRAEHVKEQGVDEAFSIIAGVLTLIGFLLIC